MHSTRSNRRSNSLARVAHSMRCSSFDSLIPRIVVILVSSEWVKRRGNLKTVYSTFEGMLHRVLRLYRNLLLSELTVSAPCVCAFSSPKTHCACCEENNNSILRRCYDQDWISILSFIGLRVVCTAYLFQFVRCSSHNWSHFSVRSVRDSQIKTLISLSKKKIDRFWVIIEISKWISCVYRSTAIDDK